MPRHRLPLRSSLETRIAQIPICQCQIVLLETANVESGVLVLNAPVTLSRASFSNKLSSAFQLGNEPFCTSLGATKLFCHICNGSFWITFKILKRCFQITRMIALRFSEGKKGISNNFKHKLDEAFA